MHQSNDKRYIIKSATADSLANSRKIQFKLYLSIIFSIATLNICIICIINGVRCISIFVLSCEILSWIRTRVRKSNLHIHDWCPTEKKTYNTRTLFLRDYTYCPVCGTPVIVLSMNLEGWWGEKGREKYCFRSDCSRWREVGGSHYRCRPARTYIRQPHSEGCRDRGGWRSPLFLSLSLSGSRRPRLLKYSCRCWPTDLIRDFRIPPPRFFQRNYCSFISPSPRALEFLKKKSFL